MRYILRILGTSWYLDVETMDWVDSQLATVLTNDELDELDGDELASIIGSRLEVIRVL